MKQYSFKLYLIKLFLLFIFCSFESVNYRHLTSSAPLSIHVLEVDPSFCKIRPVHAYNQVLGRATVLSLAKQYKALGGINGGFFHEDGSPSGILKINHQWYGFPVKLRGAIGWSDDAKHIQTDRIICESYLTIKNERIKIDGLNRNGKADEIVLYSPQYSERTPPQNTGVELAIRNQKIIAIRRNGNTVIPSDGWVISIGPQRLSSLFSDLEIEQQVDIEILTLPQMDKDTAKTWDNFPYILGGAPLLIFNGAIITDFSSEKTRDVFLSQRYARTAVGILSNGNWLFVVVDKNYPYSRGMSMNELAAFMSSQGCITALNLDGGGSSTMVYKDKIVNNTYGDEDESEARQVVRKVSDALLILNLE